MKETIANLEDELCGAKKYLKLAKEKPEYRDTFKTMALQELQHFSNLDSIMKQSMSEEDKSKWNDITEMFYQHWINKYEKLREEIEKL